VVLDSRGRRIAGLYQRNSRYYLQYRPSDRPYSIKKPLVATSLREAKLEMLRIRAGVADMGESEAMPEPIRKLTSELFRIPFRDAVQRWLAGRANSIRPSTMKSYQQDMEAWAKAFESLPNGDMCRIDSGIVSRAVDGWLMTLGPKKITRLRARKRIDTLRRFLRWAKFIKAIPAVPIDADFGRELIGKTEPKQVRPLLRKEDLLKLISEARRLTESDSGRDRLGRVLADILELIMYSGLREREAFTLTWANIDFQERCLVIHDEKCPQDGAFKKVPFNSGLEAVCTRLRDEAIKQGHYRPEGFVFRGKHYNAPVKNLRKPLNEASLRAGLHRFAHDPRRDRAGLSQSVKVGFHDLRRFFITSAVNIGTPTNIVARWVGHKDGGALIQKTYLKHDENLSRAFASRLAI